MAAWIDNLSLVLDTLGQRDQKLSDLIVQLQRWVSGLAEDRTVIGDSITGIDNLTSPPPACWTNPARSSSRTSRI